MPPAKTKTKPAAKSPEPIEISADVIMSVAPTGLAKSVPTTVPPVLEGPDAIATYQALYDTLGRAYWEASDLPSKDTIQGARDAIYDILTDLNIAKLKANTALYLALIPKIRHANESLEKIKDDIGDITKNITTAGTVIAAITRVLSIAAMF